jgi:Zn-dependent M28 family amino/carboxypeptidase
LRWGSQYFVQHPTVALTQIVADLNIDMIGRTRTSQTDSTKWTVVKPGEIHVIGSRRLSRELGEIGESVNQSYLRLAFNYRFDAPDDPSQLFLRSDQFSYAEKGIPVIFYYGGEHEDYHQPSDTADKIDYQNLEKVARTVYATAWELANRPRRPRLDNARP